MQIHVCLPKNINGYSGIGFFSEYFRVSVLKIEGQIFFSEYFGVSECPFLNRGSDFFLEYSGVSECPSVRSQNRGSDFFLRILWSVRS